MTGPVITPAVTFGVLGPVEATGADGPVPLKGPRPRAVLARLLIARGRVVPVDSLAADLWAEPPDGAVPAIRTFVSDLRRALEPDRPPRQPARLLVTTPPGYALRAAPDAVDAWRFEAAVAGSGELLAAGRAGDALAALDGALALWRGPAYAGYTDQPWTRAEIDRLDDLRRLAVERRAEALLALGRDAEAVSDLRAHTTGHPLREDAWRLLALALYRSGRQGEALAALRRARTVLVDELGVDPGPALRRLEADILAQAEHLHAADPPAPVAAAGPRRRSFVGRDPELARLAGAAADVTGHGRPGLALLSGDAGSGKTALAEALTRRLAAAGWTTAWGRSPEYDGAPAAWPWLQIIEALPDPAADPAPASASAPASGVGVGVGVGDDPAAARFQLRRAAVARLTAVAAQAPVLLVVDDLHRADDGTLDLLAALTGEPLPAAVLIVATFRATEITTGLAAALARFARAEPVRIYLGALSEPATAAIARDVAGPAADATATALIHRRSGGNPFFVRELARLLATEGAAALHRIPTGVRDVIRHRLAQLPEPAQTVLRQAAVTGRDVDPDVLAALSGPDAALDAVDRGLRAGFLTERDGLTRFTHILVRDTLYDDLSALRRSRWHAAAGEAVEALRPSDFGTLAYHFARAASRDTASRAARYARAAAEQAEARADLHEAARLWRQAVDAGERAGADADADAGDRLPAVMGLGRALAVTGHLDEARRLRGEAVTGAEKVGDPVLTARVITAFDVPAIWPRNDDEALSRHLADAADRTLAGLPDDRAELRSRLLSTLALDLRGTTTDRGRRAAREAESIARRTGDPGLLAFALNARFMHTFHRAGLAPERDRIGAELIDLAAAHELVTFEVLGRLIRLQSHCALADFAAADRQAAALDDLAARYDLPVVGVFTDWYAAFRDALGDAPGAEAKYRAAHARLVRQGMPGMSEGLLPLALLALRGTPDGLDGWGPYEPWVRPLILLGAGHRDRAAAALRALPESPYDLLREARLVLAARAALALDDRTAVAALLADLRPAAAELAGAASGVLSFGPVAEHLHRLSRP
ncbi:BTAD domain-containing putative transcriptional regulator [Jidongwangia harbinensis]|uniref:BTAD domain-containing putative transcriptional regulator n=1 Tax=Jidongwangia harbinensis TaxID=2878561 RepID=UPI001CD929D1|nr:BTAD domain-containing putative transcriptional regulator [Jidongwangia harbinensis]MCA2217747.1 AAA family ATPase [Jidongwangia harbinensis]